jgi:hypothetical protein
MPLLVIPTYFVSQSKIESNCMHLGNKYLAQLSIEELRNYERDHLKKVELQLKRKL